MRLVISMNDRFAPAYFELADILKEKMRSKIAFSSMKKPTKSTKNFSYRSSRREISFWKKEDWKKRSRNTKESSRKTLILSKSTKDWELSTINSSDSKKQRSSSKRFWK